MQKSEELKEKLKKEEKKKIGFIHRFAERLRQKGEREVRERLEKTASFLLVAAVSYLLCSAELYFGVFPVSIALAVASRKRLFPIMLGMIIAIVSGEMPIVYGFVCLTLLLLRILITLVPAVMRWLGDDIQSNSSQTEMIRIDNALMTEADIKTVGGDKVVAEDSFKRVFCEEFYVKLILAAVGGFICGLILMIERDFSFYSLCGTIALTLSAPLACLMLGGYSGETKYRSDWYEFISVTAIILLCVFSARGKMILGMPMSPFLVMLLTLCISSRRGFVGGSVIGILAGLVWSPLYAPMLAISSVVFCLISTVKKNAGVAAVCAITVVWCYYVGGESGLVGVLPPMLLSLPVFMLADKYFEMMQAPYARSFEIAEGVYFAEAVAEKTKNEAIKERLSSLSETFSSLSETIFKLSNRFRRPDVLGLKRIADSSFERTCEGCRNYDMCWGANYSDTLDAVSSVASVIHTKGVCTKEDLPGNFAALCVRCDRLVSEVNSAVEEATERIIKNGRASFFAENYDDITAILEDAIDSDPEEYECDTVLGGKVFDVLYSKGFGIGGAVVYGKRCRHILAKDISLPEGMSRDALNEIGRELAKTVGATLTDPTIEVGKDGTVMSLHSCPTVSVKCAYGRISPTGREWREIGEEHLAADTVEEEACGDMASAFITDNSYFYALISDGMGSGEEAAYTSGVCAMFIEKMLSAGNRADTTLRMLNNVIRSENMGGGSECSATVDLLELDLMSGVASFIKSGAAPTYIARRGTVYKISSRTMPVGIIKDADARITKFDTEKGDIIVMISDGCCHDSEDCPWLVEFLCDHMQKSKNTVDVGEELCERLKGEILREAIKNFPRDRERDDISVAVTVVG